MIDFIVIFKIRNCNLIFICQHDLINFRIFINKVRRVKYSKFLPLYTKFFSNVLLVMYSHFSSTEILLTSHFQIFQLTKSSFLLASSYSTHITKFNFMLYLVMYIKFLVTVYIKFSLKHTSSKPKSLTFPFYSPSHFQAK